MRKNIRQQRQRSDVRPKKALGQHFLTDESIAARIAATLDDFKDLPVMEVGPGMGVLTKYLISGGHDVKVAEIDGESIDYLRYNFPELAGRILDADFLKLDLAAVYPDGQKFCVIGNYPYNISSQIFFHVLDYRNQVECCSGMLQREVAERLAAPAGTKARGILSVLLQLWYDIDYLFTVDENVFNPPPKVKSGVIKMVRNSRTDAGCDESLFKTIVKTSFGQRRKTLRNSLRGLMPAGTQSSDMETTPSDSPHPAMEPLYPAKEPLHSAMESLLAMRPEQLTVEQFIDLTNLISSLRGK